MNPLHSALAPKPAIDPTRTQTEPSMRPGREDTREGFSDILRQQEERAAQRKQGAEHRALNPDANATAETNSKHKAKTPPASPDTAPSADVDGEITLTPAEQNDAIAPAAAEGEEYDVASEAESEEFNLLTGAADPTAQRKKPAQDAPAASLLSARFSADSQASLPTASAQPNPDHLDATSALTGMPSQTAITGTTAGAQPETGISLGAVPQRAGTAEPATTDMSAIAFASRRAGSQNMHEPLATAQGAITTPADRGTADAITKSDGSAPLVARDATTAPQTNAAPPLSASAADQASTRPSRRDLAARATEDAARAAAPAFTTQRTPPAPPAAVMPLQVQSTTAAHSSTETAGEIEWISEADFAFETRHDGRLPQTAQMRLDALAARPEIPRHIAEQLASVAQRISDRKPIEIALNPEELGRVRMTLNTAENGMVVTVLAERGETLDLMRRHIDQLAEQFREIGYDDVSFSFGAQSGSADGENAQDGNFNDDAAPDRPLAQPDATTDTAQTATAQINLTPTEGLDLRL